MSSDASQPEPQPRETASPPEGGAASHQVRPALPYPLFASVRRRILSGLVFALPIAITFWILYWLVSTLQAMVLDPVAYMARRAIGEQHLVGLPAWWKQFASPILALVLVLVFLYFLGYFGRSRVYRALDWLLLRLPIVTVIYKAVRNVFGSLESGPQTDRFKRVVLVPFPSREARSPAFVTRSLRDPTSGRTILTVFMPYAPLPTAGLLLLVPEDQVVELDWDINETMQAIISLGLSTPPLVGFDQPVGTPRLRPSSRSADST
jgi:uncharacterized membrane protein